MNKIASYFGVTILHLTLLYTEHTNRIFTFPVSPGAGCNVTDAGEHDGNWNDIHRIETTYPQILWKSNEITLKMIQNHAITRSIVYNKYIAILFLFVHMQSNSLIIAMIMKAN